MEDEVDSKHKQIHSLSQDIIALQNEIVELNDEILYQSFGLYTPIYDFATLSEYTSRLNLIREKQKDMMKDKSAVDFFDNWSVDGSISKGKKMTNDNIKQILRSFNIECENVTDNVKFSNYENMKKRIQKSYELLNKLNETNKVSITSDFLVLKLQELDLAMEYQIKKEEEKENLRILKEQQKEEALIAKEIEEKRKELEKEQKHYINALKKLDEQIAQEADSKKIDLLIDKKKDITATITDLTVALKEIDYREANQKAGYVYIISNIGAFGENVYKIGMTRRLDPQERIDELGNASVPFHFDIHAMIFTEDAPKLENALHKAFENKRVNLVNNRKEFFYVSLDQIEKTVKENFDKTVNFSNIPPAIQYRETLKLREI